MSASSPIQVQAFNTDDVAAQIRATPGWVQHYQQMSPGHFAGRVRYLDLQGVEIYEEQMNTRVEQNFSAPEGSLAFCFDRSDNALYVLNGESRNIWITPENYQEVAVVFGPEFVQRHGLNVARLEGLFMSPLNSGQNALFSRWLSAVMKRIGEWAADSPEETLNLLELSQVAGVSLRQLQHAFKAFTGMTPTHWLRLRRLNSAHRELLARTPNDTTVAEVAMNWSFWHLGRFSSSYRALFKELPSETLKRIRPSRT